MTNDDFVWKELAQEQYKCPSHWQDVHRLSLTVAQRGKGQEEGEEDTVTAAAQGRSEEIILGTGRETESTRRGMETRSCRHSGKNTDRKGTTRELGNRLAGRREQDEVKERTLAQVNPQLPTVVLRPFLVEVEDERDLTAGSSLGLDRRT
eukprot:750861-Hanusia_phi.AAC.2